MVYHHSKNWNVDDVGKIVLHAQLLLESRTSTYLEWLDNKVKLKTS